MDKNAGRNENRNQKVNNPSTREIWIPCSVETNDVLTEILAVIDKSQKNAEKKFRADAKSPLADKGMTAYLSSTSDIMCATAKDTAKNTFAVDFLYRKLIVMEKMLVQMSILMKDMPNKKQLDQIQNIESQLSHIDAIMSKIDTKQLEGKQKDKEAKSYVR